MPEAPKLLPIEVIADTLQRFIYRGSDVPSMARWIIEDLEAAGWFLDAGEPAHIDGRDFPEEGS